MSKLLQCPDCGNEQFSWIIEQVQFGNMHEFDNGQRDGEGMKMGSVTGSDLFEKGPWCTECDEHKDVDELVVAND
jgi:hypothetical protein